MHRPTTGCFRGYVSPLVTMESSCVSTVVPTLCQKLQQSPAVAILAEIDESLPEIVSAEFGYCIKEKWCRSFTRTPTIYVKDVNCLFDKGCPILLQAIQIAPSVKWFILGGPPCQDLTYAGPYHGLSGFTGPCRQRVIFPMQDLVMWQALGGSSNQS